MACDLDSVTAKRFFCVYDILHVVLFLLFAYLRTHGYLPSNLIKAVLVTMTNNKTEDTGDKNSYGTIALVIASSKITENCILELLKICLTTRCHQFGFKSKHTKIYYLIFKRNNIS